MTALARCLLLLTASCGYHDTPVATYRPMVASDGGTSGSGGMATAGSVAAAGASGGAGEAGAPIDLPCMQTYTTVVTGSTSRYKEVETGQHWVLAERDCESEGGHLIIIDDEVENTWLSTFAAKALTNNKSTHQLAWMGLGDSASEGEFHWVTGPALGTAYWSDNEPNMAFSDEDCVEMRASGQWNDDRCDAPLIYVCECDGAVSADQWCDSNAEATCGDCMTPCDSGQICDKQMCRVP